MAVLRFLVRQVHAYIIGYLRAQMPSMMGKEKVQKQLTAGKGTGGREGGRAPGTRKCSEVDVNAR